MEPDGTITWRQLWTETTARLGERREARWICEEASGASGAEWIEVLDQPVGQHAIAKLDEMVRRRSTGEPIQYVLGHWPFRGLDLFIDRRVLIPRPETELVAGVAIELARSVGPGVVVVDLGTGSGAIGLAVAAELPLDGTAVWLTDESSDALDVARANLAGIGRAAANVRIAEGSWFDALASHDELRRGVHVLVSNPPYVQLDDPRLDASVIDWEPSRALFAGADGLDDIGLIVSGVRDWLVPGGALVLEIGCDQGGAAADRAHRAGLDEVEIRQDAAGLDRMLVARAPA
ncbi:MAG: peptide chain release factor N(5)-glutamine methyltransferase [Acidimicrobiia bacterium]